MHHKDLPKGNTFYFCHPQDDEKYGVCVKHGSYFRPYKGHGVWVSFAKTNAQVRPFYGRKYNGIKIRR